jgi:hypothetical protein
MCEGTGSCTFFAETKEDQRDLANCWYGTSAISRQIGAHNCDRWIWFGKFIFGNPYCSLVGKHEGSNRVLHHILPLVLVLHSIFPLVFLIVSLHSAGRTALWLKHLGWIKSHFSFPLWFFFPFSAEGSEFFHGFLYD